MAGILAGMKDELGYKSLGKLKKTDAMDRTRHLINKKEGGKSQ
jgi:hypothetical protein